MMREIGLLMKLHNVKRILDGVKTVTRRPLTNYKNLSYLPGDVLWLKEGFYIRGDEVRYLDETDVGDGWKKMSPLFMSKRFSRVRLRITDVYSELLHEMTDDEARCEGTGSLDEFIHEWDSLYEKKPEYKWSGNPRVWVIRFEIVK
jgi:hypothetical protein